jgi:hypothetical protein
MTEPPLVARAFGIRRVKSLIDQASDEGFGHLRVDPILCAILGFGLL